MGVFIKGVKVMKDPAGAGSKVHLKLLGRTVEDKILFLVRQVLVGNVNPDPGLLSNVRHEIPAGQVPGGHGALGQR